MTGKIHISLLGRMGFRRNEKAITSLVSKKAEALLAFLVCNPRPFSRERLATMFWDNRPAERALGNLRVLLSSLRKEFSPCLLVTRTTVAFDHSAAIWLDVREFEEKLHLARAQSRADGDHSQPTAAYLEQAIALYQGDFLAGVYLRNALGFDEWATLERERLQQIYIKAAEELANYYLTRRQYQKGSDITSQLLAIDPYREANHRLMMRLLARSDQRSLALTQYETCRQILAQELDVDPSAATTALYQTIREAKSRSAHHLPAQFTPFTGRKEELSNIVTKLDNPNCRLLTLLGPGGVGKSRLAIEYARIAAAEQPDLFPHGVYFIPLAALNSGDSIIPALAGALDVQFRGPEEPHTQMLNFLREKQMLLLLDNFEHLLDSNRHAILEILQSAPSIKMLITSRERLRLRAEWLLEVAGLKCAWALTEEMSAPAAAFAQCSAGELFGHIGRRISPGFSASGEARHICRICRLVEGMPLGIELSASWVRVLSCADIAAKLEADLDFLSSSMHDVPDRHRSLRASFEQSWNRLDDSQQSHFSRLSIFKGSFASQAARAVVGATSDQISQLADRSLLQKVAPDRYEFHTLIHLFAMEKLRGSNLPTSSPAATPANGGTPWQETAAAHCRYYLDLMATKEPQLSIGDQRAALEEISVEIENIRSAWDWAVAQGYREGIASAYQGLSLYYLCRSWHPEAAGRLGAAVTRFSPNGSAPHDEDELVGMLLAHQGEFLNLSGKHQESSVALRRSVAILEQHGTPSKLAFATNHLAAAMWRMGQLEEAGQQYKKVLRLIEGIEDPANLSLALAGLGIIAYIQGETEEARDRLQRSIQLSQQLGDTRKIASNSNNLGLVLRSMGAMDEATEQFEKARRLFESLDDQWGLASAKSNLGLIAESRQQFEEAKRYYQQSHQIFKRIGDQRGTGLTANNLGVVAEGLGHYEEAARFYHHALEIRKATHDQVGIARTLTNLSNVYFNQGRFTDSQQAICQALKLAMDLDSMPTVIEAIIRIAELKRHAGHLAGAAALLSFAAAHPACMEQLRRQAQQNLEAIKVDLPQARYQTAVQSLHSQTAQAVVGELLQEAAGM